MKRFWPIGLLIIYFVFLFKDFFFKGLIPVPADTLVGAYFPWLDYKWGYIVGVPVKNGFISDVFSTLFIWKHISTDIFKQGIIPYWNNYSFSGTPLLATFHSTVLSPWNIFFLLPKFTGWSIYIFASFLFSALSMYLFLITIVKNRLARFIGAIVFSLAGPMTTWAEFGTAVWAAGSIPLILLGVEMVIVHRKPKYYFLIVASTVLLILSGHVQLLTYSFVLVPLYALFKSKGIKATFLVVCALMIGVLLTSIQLIPTADFFTRSIRTEEKYSQSFHFGLIAPQQLIRMWTPDFFGNPTTGNSWGSYVYHEYASFVGTLVLPLILAALFIRRNISVKYFSWVFIISLFLVLDQPISRWFFGLPLPLITYSSASRLFFMTGLSGSVLTAIFLDQSRWKRLFIPILILIFISITSIYFVPAEFKNISLKNSIIPLSQLSLLLLILLIKKFIRFIPLTILLFVCFDMSRYFLKYNPFVSAHFVFPTTPAISYLMAQKTPFRIVREPTNLIPPNTWTMYGLENVEGYDPLYLQSYNRYFHLINSQPYFDSAGRYSELTGFNPLFLNASNVKYLITLKPKDNRVISNFYADIQKEKYPLVFSDKQTEIYENPNVLPRAYFVPQVISVPGEIELANILNNQSFNPKNTAVLISSTQIATSSGSINNYSTKPNEFSFIATTSSSGLLVVSNSYDPGWKAYVDNTSTPVYRANGGLMAISVPIGSHQIDFNYLPPYMGLALIVTSFSWLGVISAYFVFTRKIV